MLSITQTQSQLNENKTAWKMFVFFSSLNKVNVPDTCIRSNKMSNFLRVVCVDWRVFVGFGGWWTFIMFWWCGILGTKLDSILYLWTYTIDPSIFWDQFSPSPSPWQSAYQLQTNNIHQSRHIIPLSFTEYYFLSLFHVGMKQTA